MSSRVAVFGGMFDPVHRGHMQAAQFALKHLSVDCLKMVPCHWPNHKESARTAGHHRLAMLELVTSPIPKIELEPIELERDGLSYTVDTLEIIKQQHVNQQDNSLVFVLGLDSFNTLTQWHRWKEILELSHLLVLSRAGSSLSQETMAAVSFAQRRVATSEELFVSESGKIIYREDFHFDIASSSVRQKLAQNRNTAPELDQRVIQYINDKCLYQAHYNQQTGVN